MATRRSPGESLPRAPFHLLLSFLPSPLALLRVLVSCFPDNSIGVLVSLRSLGISGRENSPSTEKESYRSLPFSSPRDDSLEIILFPFISYKMGAL